MTYEVFVVDEDGEPVIDFRVLTKLDIGTTVLKQTEGEEGSLELQADIISYMYDVDNQKLVMYAVCDMEDWMWKRI